MYGRTGQGLGAAFLAKKGTGGGGGMLNVGRRETGDAQKFSYPNNQCPPGYRQVGAGSDKPPQGYSKPWGDYVMCRQAPSNNAPARPAPAPTTNINVSPAIQTQVSPMISPVFSQMQDSPGATQAATTAQVSPGGQSAETGGAGGGNGATEAMLEFMRRQAEQDAQRRAELEAARQRQAEQQRQQQLELQRQQEAARQQQIERQQQAEKAAAEERARREQQAAAMQADYQRKLEESQKQAPSTFTSTVQPGASFIPASDPDPTPEGAPAPAVTRSLNWPLIAAVVIGGGVVIYFVMDTRGRKK